VISVMMGYDWYRKIRSAAGVPCGLGFEAYCCNRCRYGVLMT